MKSMFRKLSFRRQGCVRGGVPTGSAERGEEFARALGRRASARKGGGGGAGGGISSHGRGVCRVLCATARSILDLPLGLVFSAMPWPVQDAAGLGTNEGSSAPDPGPAVDLSSLDELAAVLDAPADDNLEPFTGLLPPSSIGAPRGVAPTFATPSGGGEIGAARPVADERGTAVGLTAIPPATHASVHPSSGESSESYSSARGFAVPAPAPDAAEKVVAAPSSLSFPTPGPGVASSAGPVGLFETSASVFGRPVPPRYAADDAHSREFAPESARRSENPSGVAAYHVPIQGYADGPFLTPPPFGSPPGAYPVAIYPSAQYVGFPCAVPGYAYPVSAPAPYPHPVACPYPLAGSAVDDVAHRGGYAVASGARYPHGLTLPLQQKHSDYRQYPLQTAQATPPSGAIPVQHYSPHPNGGAPASHQQQQQQSARHPHEALGSGGAVRPAESRARDVFVGGEGGRVPRASVAGSSDVGFAQSGMLDSASRSGSGSCPRAEVLPRESSAAAPSPPGLGRGADGSDNAAPDVDVGVSPHARVLGPTASVAQRATLAPGHYCGPALVSGPTRLPTLSAAPVPAASSAPAFGSAVAPTSPSIANAPIIASASSVIAGATANAPSSPLVAASALAVSPVPAAAFAAGQSPAGPAARSASAGVSQQPAPPAAARSGPDPSRTFAPTAFAPASAQSSAPYTDGDDDIGSGDDPNPGPSKRRASTRGRGSGAALGGRAARSGSGSGGRSTARGGCGGGRSAARGGCGGRGGRRAAAPDAVAGVDAVHERISEALDEDDDLDEDETGGSLPREGAVGSAPALASHRTDRERERGRQAQARYRERLRDERRKAATERALLHSNLAAARTEHAALIAQTETLQRMLVYREHCARILDIAASELAGAAIGQPIRRIGRGDGGPGQALPLSAAGGGAGGGVSSLHASVLTESNLCGLHPPEVHRLAPPSLVSRLYLPAGAASMHSLFVAARTVDLPDLHGLTEGQRGKIDIMAFMIAESELPAEVPVVDELATADVETLSALFRRLGVELGVSQTARQIAGGNSPSFFTPELSEALEDARATCEDWEGGDARAVADEWGHGVHPKPWSVDATDDQIPKEASDNGDRGTTRADGAGGTGPRTSAADGAGGAGLGTSNVGAIGAQAAGVERGGRQVQERAETDVAMDAAMEAASAGGFGSLPASVLDGAATPDSDASGELSVEPSSPSGKGAENAMHGEPAVAGNRQTPPAPSDGPCRGGGPFSEPMVRAPPPPDEEVASTPRELGASLRVSADDWSALPQRAREAHSRIVSLIRTVIERRPGDVARALQGTPEAVAAAMADEAHWRRAVEATELTPSQRRAIASLAARTEEALCGVIQRRKEALARLMSLLSTSTSPDLRSLGSRVHEALRLLAVARDTFSDERAVWMHTTARTYQVMTLRQKIVYPLFSWPCFPDISKVVRITAEDVAREHEQGKAIDTQIPIAQSPRLEQERAASASA